MAQRFGIGYDVHPLEAGRPMVLGGVVLDSEVGPAGHSDGDAVCHAITDALLGAAALGDIGHLFPDTDPQYAGADSVELLRQAVTKLGEAGFTPWNVDVTLIGMQCVRTSRQRWGFPLNALASRPPEVKGLGLSAGAKVFQQWQWPQ